MKQNNRFSLGSSLFCLGMLALALLSGCFERFEHLLLGVEVSQAEALEIKGQVACHAMVGDSCEAACVRADIFRNLTNVEICPTTKTPLWEEARVARLEKCVTSNRMRDKQLNSFALTSNGSISSAALSSENLVVVVSVSTPPDSYGDYSRSTQVCMIGSGSSFVQAEFDWPSALGEPVPDLGAVYSLAVERAEQTQNHLRLDLDLGCSQSARLLMKADWNGKQCQGEYDLSTDEQTRLSQHLAGVSLETRRGRSEASAAPFEHQLTVGYACQGIPVVKGKRQLRRPPVVAELSDDDVYPTDYVGSFAGFGRRELLAYLQELVASHEVMSDAACPAEWPLLFEK